MAACSADRAHVSRLQKSWPRRVPKSLFRLPHTGLRRAQKESMMGETGDINTTITSASLLQGQVALITGASRGIGAATALLFARHGAAVGVNYYNNGGQAQEVV